MAYFLIKKGVAIPLTKKTFYSEPYVNWDNEMLAVAPGSKEACRLAALYTRGRIHYDDSPANPEGPPALHYFQLKDRGIRTKQICLKFQKTK